jgi:hypothetical protein
MKRSKLIQFAVIQSFVMCLILTGCEKDQDLVIQQETYQHTAIQANGPRIDQTPVRLNTKATAPIKHVRHDTAKNSISNIR